MTSPERPWRRVAAAPGRLVRIISRALTGVRFRILVYAVLILFFGIVVTVFTMRQILVSQLDVRVQEQLQQEVTEFRTLTGGTNPNTGEPFEDDLAALFDTFLDRNIPNVDEQWLTFLDGQLYRQKSFAETDPALEDEFGLIRSWAEAQQTSSGTAVTDEGDFRYLAVPVRVNDEARGTFVVASQIDAEREEIEAAVRAAALVGTIALLLGSLVAYLAAGRVLHPLRELTETARSIEETDLTSRIEVTGNDELAELGHTFNGMLDRLEQAFGSQRELIRSVSHEMRTPITIVRGHLELLGDDPEERRETIELVTDELDRMNRLVQDLLTLARAERPDFLSPDPVEIRPFLEEIVSKAQALGDRRWQVEAGAAPDEAMLDRQRLSQAILNLADNAIQQTRDGDPITLGAESQGRNHLRFWIGDPGPGIPVEMRDQIFERFQRGDSRRYTGTGLGLAIVRAIAEAHGGRAWVGESELGGAELSVLITAPRQEQPTAVL